MLYSGDFGLIGLAVMGQNLILNAADHGFTVVAFNRTTSKVDRFLANEAKGKDLSKAPSRPISLPRLQWLPLLTSSSRQVHCRCPLRRRVRRQAQAPTPHHASRHGR